MRSSFLLKVKMSLRVGDIAKPNEKSLISSMDKFVVKYNLNNHIGKGIAMNELLNCDTFQPVSVFVTLCVWM